MPTTLQDVFDTTRSLLQGGSTSAARGLGNGVLQYAFSQAYTEMWQTMEQVQTPRVRREFYCTVPAYTSYVDPAAAGVYDMGEPELMYERGSLTSVQIAATSTDTPIIVTTVTPHGLATNADVTIGQVTNTRAPWGRFFITVTGASTFTLNGSVSDGVAGIGGTVTTSPEIFSSQPVRWVNTLGDYWQPQQRLCRSMWESGVFNFPGATDAAQIMVTYFADPTPPANALSLLGVPAAATFLATRTAGIVAQSRGLYQMADTLEIRALGPGRQADGRGGQLRGFLNIMVNGLQRDTYRMQPFNGGLCAWDDGLWPLNTGLSGGGGSTTGGSLRSNWYVVPIIGGVANVDLAQGDTQQIILTGNTVVANSTPMTGTFRLVIDQNGTGGWAVTFGSKYLGLTPSAWSGAGTPGSTRVVIPMSVDPSGNAEITGAIIGPTAL